jgi:hypothetical protein
VIALRDFMNFPDDTLLKFELGKDGQFFVSPTLTLYARMNKLVISGVAKCPLCKYKKFMTIRIGERCPTCDNPETFKGGCGDVEVVETP